MYIVYDPNHQVKMVTDLPKAHIVVTISNTIHDPKPEVEWERNSDIIRVFTNSGVYVIQYVSMHQWIV